MNILVIYCHPSKESYTFQVFEHLKNTLSKQNWRIQVSDLYADHFISDMSEKEYLREGFAETELSIPEDIIEEHKKIEAADCVIFLYPVWWSDCPAKLKGWFDRVYSVGYAYGQKPNIPKMKTIKFGIAICTAGHPNKYLDQIGIAKSMKTIMIEDRLGKRFEHKEMLLLGGTLEIEKVRDLHMKEIEKLVSKIERYCVQ